MGMIRDTGHGDRPWGSFSEILKAKCQFGRIRSPCPWVIAPGQIHYTDIIPIYHLDHGLLPGSVKKKKTRIPKETDKAFWVI